MESSDKLKELYIKNNTCYYFGDILKLNSLLLIIL